MNSHVFETEAEFAEFRKNRRLLTSDWKVVPRGPYCYSGKTRCPFHYTLAFKDHQENGYCSYLNEADFECTQGLSLLWDSCKECDINWEGDDKYG